MIAVEDKAEKKHYAKMIAKEKKAHDPKAGGTELHYDVVVWNKEGRIVWCNEYPPKKKKKCTDANTCNVCKKKIEKNLQYCLRCRKKKNLASRKKAYRKAH